MPFGVGGPPSSHLSGFAPRMVLTFSRFFGIYLNQPTIRSRCEVDADRNVTIGRAVVAETFLVDYAGLNGTAVVRFAGELDLCGASRAKEAGLAALSRVASDGSPLIIDLSDLVFCDSRGLHALVDIRQRANASGHAVVLRRPNAMLQRMLALTDLEDLFTIDEGPSG